MKLNVEKALKVCGNNNIYQKLLYIAVALSWFSVDFVSISFPLLELEPRFSCRENDSFTPCSLKKACALAKEDFKVEIEYKNLVTDFNLYCDTTLVILIGVLYTSGILIGSIVSSHFSDVLGRKPVLLMCQLLFGLAAISMTIAPNMYFILCSLFFTGFASAGGTMVSFLYIYEVLNPSKRSLYGTLINFSFAVAGMIYFTCFLYLKNWVYIAYICIMADFVAFLLVAVYFLESPRFLISKGYYDKALKVLYKIAKKNGKSRDFYRYILSDMLYRNQSNSNNILKAEKNEDENSDYFKKQNIKNNYCEDNNHINNNNNCSNDNSHLLSSESNLITNSKKASIEAKIDCNHLKNSHFENDLCVSNNNINYLNSNTNTNNSNNNSNTRVIPSASEFFLTNTKRNSNNSFLKNVKINSNSLIEGNSLDNSNSNENSNPPAANPTIHSKNLNLIYPSDNLNCNINSSNSQKSPNSELDSKSNVRAERSDSIDSQNIDIDDFIKKIQLQESASISREPDNERKNEPLIVSSKSTNFTEYRGTAEESKKKEQSFLALFKFKSLRYKFLICCLFWFVMSFTYYGMSFFLKKGGEDVFLDGYIIYLAEGISYFVTGIIMSVSFLGRVRSLSIMMMLTAVSTMVFYYLKDMVGIYDKIPLFIARFSITSIYSIMYTYSTEVYPTSIRAKGLGLNSFCARISCIMVPIIVELVDNPFAIFSAMTFFSFFLTFSLPETNNRELEDEIFEEKILQKRISIDTN